MNTNHTESPTNHPNFLEVFGLTGKAFLDEICHAVRDAFSANTAFIASLGVVEADYLFIEAISSNRDGTDISDFCTRGTACADVFDTGRPLVVCSNIRGIYPEAINLQRMGSEAYLGLPLQKPDGTCTGVFVLDWAEEVDQARMQYIITTMNQFLARVSEEVRRTTLEHVLPSLVSPVRPWAPHFRTEVFRHIVEQAAALTKVKTVAIVRRMTDDRSKFRILAIHCDGEDVDGFEGALVEYKNIPCSNMTTHDCYFMASGVQTEYPGISLLEELGVDSYLGYSFWDSAGETIGHIAFLHNRPMRDSVKDCGIMQIISTRAGQELQRYALEQQRDAMEASLRVRSKLESLGTMAGTIAHDFNNQLTAMIANTELASLELPKGHPSKMFLTNAEQSIWRARDVISEILDFAGNSNAAPFERVSLGEVVASAVSEFEPRLNARSRIASAIAPNLPDVETRRIQVFQILSNLIANGLDALKEHSTHKVTITVDVVALPDSERRTCLTGQCAKLPEQCVRVELKDAGSGMDAETTERIFDPYFSTKGVSRGLGLSSVLGIAKRMDIGLTFDSQVDVGTTFRLYFAPLASSELVDSNETVLLSSQAEESCKTALVVDDEESVNDVFSQILTLWGWRVLKADSGEEAVTLAKSADEHHLAFVDIVMPGMDGIETLGELRKLHPDLPAIMVSGYSDNTVSQSFENDEAFRFLVKPFGTNVLKEAIDEVLGVEA